MVHGVATGGTAADILRRDVHLAVAEDLFGGFGKLRNLPADNVQLRIGGHRCQLVLHAQGQGDVVGIHARDKLALADCQSLPQGNAEPLVFRQT